MSDALLDLQRLDTTAQQLTHRRTHLDQRQALLDAEAEQARQQVEIDTVAAARVEVASRQRRLEAEASLAEVERLRAAATEPLVLEAVDSDSSVGDAPQSCRIVHETTALGSHDADAAAYFVDEASSSDDANEAAGAGEAAYFVDEGSDTE